MLETVKNRGPDSFKITKIDEDGVFAFARLAFVGEAESSQPYRQMIDTTLCSMEKYTIIRN